MNKSEFLAKLAEIIIEVLKEIRQNNQSLTKENFVKNLEKNEEFKVVFSKFSDEEIVNDVAINLLKTLNDLKSVLPGDLLDHYREIFEHGKIDEKKSAFIDLILKLAERLEKTLSSFSRVKSLIKDVALSLETTVEILDDSVDKSINMIQANISQDKTLIGDIESTVNEIGSSQSFETLKKNLYEKLNSINFKIKEALKDKEDFVVYVNEKKDDIKLIKTSFKSKNDEFESIKQELEQYKKLVIRDFLTGLYNRQYFDEMLQGEIEVFNRYGQKFVLLFIDVDDFKEINDNLGHVAGDFVLQYLANILKKNIRKIDYAFRYGGDEFVILMPNTAFEKGKVVAERIVNSIKSTVFRYKSSNLKLTVSIGVEEMKEGYTATTILEMADKKMLKAKSIGKNMVVCEL